ncbi:hypothetical protein NFI96_008230 [Prochilodus magdalenae]|nr:hypothetical protein NFI96_008230 [Prochilodus magdalenae]
MGSGTLALAVLVILLLAEAVEGRRSRAGRTQSPPSYRSRSEGAESFPLDFTPVEGNMDTLMRQVQNLAQSLYPCSTRRLDQDMKLRYLDNSTVTCNDGSPAGGFMVSCPGRVPSSERTVRMLNSGDVLPATPPE